MTVSDIQVLDANFITIESHGLIVRVCRQSGAVVDAWYRGRPVLRPYIVEGSEPFDVLNAACFPMVPFAGRIEGNAFVFDERRYVLTPNTTLDKHVLHGDGWLGLWTVVEQTPTDVILAFKHVADESSPFTYESQLIVSVVGGKLGMQLSAINRGPVALPFGLGLHPFFPLANNTTLQLNAEQCWDERDDHLPGKLSTIPEALDFSIPKAIPNGPNHVGFENWQESARLVIPEHDLQIDICSDNDPKRLQLFTPHFEADTKDAARYVCLEPMTHTCNAHNMTGDFGLRRLGTDQSMRLSVEIKPMLLSEA